MNQQLQSQPQNQSILRDVVEEATLFSKQNQLQSNKHAEQGAQNQRIRLLDFLFPSFAVRSVTFPLSVAMLIYFWAAYAYINISDKLFGCVLYSLGARFTPVIQSDGHFHRLLVSVVLYGSISQCIIATTTMNMFGYVAERRFGWRYYLAFLILSGYNANLLSGLILPYNVSVGSTGIVFAILIIYGSQLFNQTLGTFKVYILTNYVIMFGVNFIPLIGARSLDICTIVGSMLSTLLLALYMQQFKKLKHGKLLNYGALGFVILMTILQTLLIFILEVEDIDVDRFC